jgi:hypothetical protein
MLPIFSASSCSSLALLSLHHQVQTPNLKQHTSASGNRLITKGRAEFTYTRQRAYFIGDF